jgi:hypothetical protein
MRSLTKKISIAAIAVAAAVGLGACEASEPDATSRENTSRMGTYEKLQESQPALTMDYSPTRATKNFWIETWDEPGKLAFVYLLGSEGNVIGYYIFEGLPVSYCTSLVPPVREYRVDGDGSTTQGVLGPAPSVDGTFSSASNCDTYYGKDATTGTYLEYKAGFGINPLVMEEPMPLQEGDRDRPFGPSTIDEVR